MKCNVSTVCVFLCTLIVVCYSAPFLPAQYSVSSNLQIGANSPPPTTVATTASSTAGGSGGGLTNILSDIDLPGLLRGVNSVVKIVGIFCPPLSQVLDNVIQNVTSTAFRVFGRLILQSGGLGGSGSSGGSGGDTQRVSVVLPTFPPDEDDEDYDEDEDSDAEMISSTTSSNNNEISSRLDVRIDESSTSTTTTENVSPTNEDNAISKRHVRVIRETDDQEEAESAPQPAEDGNDGDDADRNKRYLPFGGSVNAQVSGGGSGNFLFDIIRNTADRAARTVGTVYRMVAGTENFGYGLTTTSETAYKTSAAPTVKLVAGSGATEESDHHANAPGGVAEIDITKAVGHDTTAGEGIPGPITRLFVIANRGLANLVQDLILRLAQTSERLVNFKARLITSLI